MDIVCERFTTSKLESLDDLLNIQSYGFRGEALASISYISYVTIVSKTESQMSGFKQKYVNGKPTGKAIPLAANNGTIITIEDLFYNLLMRKKALSSYSHEYNLILDLITKYSIHYSKRVSFSLKKSSENCDLNSSLENSINENISRLFGTNIGNNLIEISFEDNIALNFSLKGLISNQNIHQKNYVFILFINDRLVDCQTLKKAIDLVYSNCLMKGFHPFVYLSIKIESKNIDVNIHPTKSVVHFLHEQEICENIVQLIQSKLSKGETRLMNADQSLMNLSFFQKQSNTENSEQNQKVSENHSEDSSDKRPNESKRQTPQRPDKQIRTDCKDRRIQEFLSHSKRNLKTRRKLNYQSLLSLRNSVREDTDNGLQDMICGSSYVGCVDETFILLQFDTQLLLVNACHLNRDLFYQLFLIDFGNFSQIKFSNPCAVTQLVQTYLEEKTQQKGIDSEVKEVEDILFKNREMICDYFAINISDDKHLLSLPVLLDGFVPNFAYLGEFLYQLAKEVNWMEEKSCFQTIGSVLSQFYAKPPKKFESDSEHQKWAKIIENIIYPTYKAVLCPPKRLADSSTFFVTTNLMDLYKVFERC